MSARLVLPKASTRGGVRHPGCEVLPVLGLNAILGVPAYFCSLFFAYGLADSVGLSGHLTFLGLIAAYAVITGVLALSPTAWRYWESSLEILTFGILTSFAANAAFVGLGSIASATSKSQGSVSADFSTTTDIVVTLSLFGFAAACAFAADAVRRSD